MNNNLIIRADSDSRIGAGHVMRCIALAQCYQARGGQVTFIINCGSRAIKQRLSSEGFRIVPLSRPYPDPADWEVTTQELKACSDPWLVVDGYHFDSKYHCRIKELGYKLLVIDDMAKLNHYYADLILNQNIYDQQLQYSFEPYTRLLLGSRYALLRTEFLEYKYKNLPDMPEIARKILVTLGGADPDNLTLKIIRALKMVDVDNMEVVIVLGPENIYREEIKNELCHMSFGHRLKLSVRNMSEVMAWADMAISAGGGTFWETAYMGLPCSMIILAENQVANVEKLSANGVILNLGWHDSVSENQMAQSLEKVIKSKKMREEMSLRSKALVDGAGRERVVEFMTAMKLSLRSVLEQDCEVIWKWANDAEARAVSFYPEFIPWDDHIRWFRSKLNDPKCFFYLVINQKGTLIGQVRIEKNKDEVVISVSIDKVFRGCGYGSVVIGMASQMFFRACDESFISAYIKQGNKASECAFIKAGFKKERETTIRGQRAIILRLHRGTDDKNK